MRRLIWEADARSYADVAQLPWFEPAGGEEVSVEGGKAIIRLYSVTFGSPNDQWIEVYVGLVAWTLTGGDTAYFLVLLFEEEMEDSLKFAVEVLNLFGNAANQAVLPFLTAVDGLVANTKARRQ
ncbi:MAG: hypothetical protein C5B53_13625 [Candidatus Melainabacteria bacterium]|nr:MAG: hypothetical protein C5B53_13625 [Candidatus Melainabacteria bacterium]